MYLVGLRSTSVRAEQRFPEPLAPLSLVEYVAVWALKLPALHTDVLKTHEFQSFSAKLLEFNKWHPPNHLLPCLNTCLLYTSELELFTTVDVIGQGLPLLMPKGVQVIQTLQRWIEDEEEKRGYMRTKTRCV